MIESCKKEECISTVSQKAKCASKVYVTLTVSFSS